MGVMKVRRASPYQAALQLLSCAVSGIHYRSPSNLPPLICTLVHINPQPELVMRNIIPVVMAGVLGIYGLIVAVVLIQAGMCVVLVFV